MAYWIKAFSFFIKEIHDVRRQPRLMISLVGGPLLVLAIFGATFRSANPFISTVLVWPENGIPGVSQEQAVQFISSNFHLAKVTSDKEEAMRMLENGEVDVVQIVPQADFSAGGSATPVIQVFSRTVDPQAEAWIRSLTYGETNFINQRLLFQGASVAKEKASEKYDQLVQSQTEFQKISQNLGAQDIEHIGSVVKSLRGLLAELARFLPPEGLAQANLSPELRDLYRDIEVFSNDLDELDQALRQGNLLALKDRLIAALDGMENLRGTMKVFITTPVEKIITPVKDSYTNLRGGPYSLVIFFAPSVLALLVQQLAITLAALGLVRERQMGSFEMFRVSPLKFSQILLGKSLAYILYVVLSGVILAALMMLLRVPMPAYPVQFLLLLVFVAAASVGIGLLISSVSSTDSQAIQFTMLVLLLSIFFTGFFMPLTGFLWPAWIISFLLPMSYAIDGFQALMLVGSSPMPYVWIGLGVVIVLSYSLIALIMRRQYRNVMD